MKTVILALLVLLVVSQGEALRCRCAGTHKICPNTVETCHQTNPVCASVVFNTPKPSHFRGCMKAHDCDLLKRSSVAFASCCSTDLCN